jgi:hypothetical protein
MPTFRPHRSVLHLDDFVPEATWRMQAVDHAGQEIPIFAEFREIIARRAGPHVRLASLERFAFYERTRGALGRWGRARTGSTAIYYSRKVSFVPAALSIHPPAPMVRVNRRIIAHCRNPVR